MKLSPCDPEALGEAARILRGGGLVVVPTETVYGLAADALNADAVKRIYEVKGRPPDNPLICHVESLDEARGLAAQWPEFAERLAARFWPGPLTIVLPKSGQVPFETTAGLDTVALRMPGHEAFRDLIRLTGRPLAAPSANPYMGLSPTSVGHLAPEILKGVDMVLDGGPCAVGIESTVVDLFSHEPAILRPGMIGASEIEQALEGPLGQADSSIVRSPGMHRRHYAPLSRVIVRDSIGDLPGLVFDREANEDQISMPSDAASYARSFYSALHQMDRQRRDAIYIETPPRGEEWKAIWDRIVRAAAAPG